MVGLATVEGVTTTSGVCCWLVGSLLATGTREGIIRADETDGAAAVTGGVVRNDVPGEVVANSGGGEGVRSEEVVIG